MKWVRLAALLASLSPGLVVGLVGAVVIGCARCFVLLP
jgi:hypothetical protein